MRYILYEGETVRQNEPVKQDKSVRQEEPVSQDDPERQDEPIGLDKPVRNNEVATQVEPEIQAKSAAHLLYIGNLSINVNNIKQNS